MKKIGVFIGASLAHNDVYTKNAKLLAEAIVRNNCSLVYGGASVGLMGILANEVLRLGGEVVGIMPQSLVDKEIAHQKLTTLHIVDSMSDRKTKMFDLADAFIVFPGGIGTLEELFELWSATKLGVYNKPIGILNIEQYYQHILDFMQHSIKVGLSTYEHLSLIKDSSSVHELMEYIICN